MDQIVKFNPAEAVRQYIKARRWKDARKKAYEAEVARVSAAMDEIEGRLLQHLEEEHSESIRTTEGTFYKTPQDKASLSDPEAFIGFIRATGKLELLERRVSVTALREHLKETNELPPGTKFTQRMTVNVKAVSGKEYV